MFYYIILYHMIYGRAGVRQRGVAPKKNTPRRSAALVTTAPSRCVYIYIYIYMHTISLSIYTYIYIYISIAHMCVYIYIYDNTYSHLIIVICKLCCFVLREIVIIPTQTSMTGCGEI